MSSHNTTHKDWRQAHLGRLLGHAMRRFDDRVLYLMAHNVDVPLALSNLAARAQVSAAHIHITRHLGLNGSRLSDLAASAGMSEMCEALVPMLLEQLAGDPGLVGEIGALNRWPEQSWLPLSSYLDAWRQSCQSLGAPGRLADWIRACLIA